MKTFEERLERLEALSQEIRSGSLPLADSLEKFEEGIKLARGLEKELEKMEKRVEILLNPAQPPVPGEDPNLELFSDLGEV